MKKTFTLSVSNPCSEKWENFSSTSHGGFCGSCQKEVIDFTAMSDQEIADFFAGNKIKTCGRFRNDQMKSYLMLPHPTINIGFGLMKAGLLSLFLFLIVKPSVAQSTKPVTEVVKSATTSSSFKADDHTYQIAGVVTAEDDGSVLPGVNIYLKHDLTVGTVSDSEGYFEFPRELKEGDILLFSFIGMETQEYRVPAKVASNVSVKLNVSMEMSCMVTLGEVAVNEAYSEPHIIQKLWRKVRAIF